MEPAKLGRTIKEITAKYTEDGQGINILANPDEFKSTYQILLELSKVWGDLTDTESAYLLEKLAGKHRASVLSGLLSDEELLVNAYEAAANSAGSAMEEYAKRTESIEYHLGQLKAAWQDFAQNAIPADLIITVIDLAKALLELANNIGFLQVASTGITSVLAIFAGVKGIPYFDSVGKQMAIAGEKLSIFGNEIDIMKDVVEDNANGISKETAKTANAAVDSVAETTSEVAEKVSDALDGVADEHNKVGDAAEASATRQITSGEKAVRTFAGFKKTIAVVGKTLLKSFGIGMGVTALLAAIGNAFDKYEAAKHVVSNLKESIEDLESQVVSFKSELDELSSKDVKTGADVERIAFLKEQIALEEELIEIQKERLARTTVDEVNKYYSGDRSGVNSEFMDDMDDMKVAMINLELNQNSIDALKEQIEQTKASMADLAETDNEYIRLSGILETSEKQLIELEDKKLQYRTDAITQLQTLTQKRADLAEIIETLTGAEKTEAIAARDAIDADIAQYKQTLGLNVSTKELKETISKQRSELIGLNAVIAKVNSGQKISKEEIESLSKAYPELTDIIKDFGKETEGSFEISEDAVESLSLVQATALLNMIDNQISLTEASIAESKIRIQQYRNERDELRALNSAAMSSVEQQRAQEYKILFNSYYKESEKKPGTWEFRNEDYRDTYNERIADLERKYSANSSDEYIASLYKAEEEFWKQQEKDVALIESNEEKLKEYYKLRDEYQSRVIELSDSINGDDNGDPGLGNSDLSDSISVFDKYANALAKVQEQVESYDRAVELAQARLDLNQSQEERTVDLLSEEQGLYADLISAQEARYKIVNDTLWLQSEQLKVLQQQASEKIQAVTGLSIDASELANWTSADLEDFVVKAKLDIDDNEAHADLNNFLNGLIESGDYTHELYVQWYNLKQELRETRKQELQSILDWQKDSLEKFDDARKQTEMLLDLLEEVEDTEEQRMNLASGLESSYEAQKESILAMHEANSAKMAELAQDMESNQELYQTLLKQNEELEENYLDSLQAQLGYKKQLLELEQEHAEKLAETEIYGEQGQKKWEDARQDEIDALNDQIEALQKKAEEDDYAEQMAEYEEELAEKQEEIAELYQKLDNLRSQETVQTLKEQEDGSFQWEYVEDQIAINETLEEIADKEVEIEELKNEIKEAEEERALEEEIAYLESQIEAIEDEVQRRQDLYDEEIDLIEATYQKEMQQLSRWLQDEIANWQARIAASEANLKAYDQVNTEGWQVATENTNAALTELSKVYTDQFNYIMSVIKNYEQTAMEAVARIHAAIAAAKAAAREAEREAGGSSGGSHANGLKFVESNNYIARLHYGERVLTRQEAQQYNELEDDIKSGNLKAYFESAQTDAMNSISSSISASVASVNKTSVPAMASNSTSFVIEHLELPNVQDSEDFAAVLQSWARNEFGGLAQKAKIVRAK